MDKEPRSSRRLYHFYVPHSPGIWYQTKTFNSNGLSRISYKYPFYTITLIHFCILPLSFFWHYRVTFFFGIVHPNSILQFHSFLIGQWHAHIISLTNQKKVQENSKVDQCDLVKWYIFVANPELFLETVWKICKKVDINCRGLVRFLT